MIFTTEMKERSLLLETKDLFLLIRGHNILASPELRATDLKNRLTVLKFVPSTSNITRLGLKLFIEREQRRHVERSK